MKDTYCFGPSDLLVISLNGGTFLKDLLGADTVWLFKRSEKTKHWTIKKIKDRLRSEPWKNARKITSESCNIEFLLTHEYQPIRDVGLELFHEQQKSK